MKVKSTGLGKTQLQCHFDGFSPKENGEPSVVMIITSTEPVHWHIEADLGGKDLRQMAGQMLKPATIWHLLKLLVLGSEAKGFVMEKDGGRRSTRDRVQREPVQRDLSATAPAAPAAPAPAAAAPVDRNPRLSVAAAAAPAPVNGTSRHRAGHGSPGGQGRLGRAERPRAAARRAAAATGRSGEAVRGGLGAGPTRERRPPASRSGGRSASRSAAHAAVLGMTTHTTRITTIGG